MPGRRASRTPDIALDPNITAGVSAITMVMMARAAWPTRMVGDSDPEFNLKLALTRRLRRPRARTGRGSTVSPFRFRAQIQPGSLALGQAVADLQVVTGSRTGTGRVTTGPVPAGPERPSAPFGPRFRLAGARLKALESVPAGPCLALFTLELGSGRSDSSESKQGPPWHNHRRAE